MGHGTCYNTNLTNSLSAQLSALGQVCPRKLAFLGEGLLGSAMN